MNILEIVIMVVLVIIIVGGISIPSDIHSIVGGVPGIIIILFIVFYLFSVSVKVFLLLFTDYLFPIQTNLNNKKEYKL